jgi:hypothetical protein
LPLWSEVPGARGKKFYRILGRTASDDGHNDMSCMTRGPWVVASVYKVVHVTIKGWGEGKIQIKTTQRFYLQNQTTDVVKPFGSTKKKASKKEVEARNILWPRNWDRGYRRPLSPSSLVSSPRDRVGKKAVISDRSKGVVRTCVYVCLCRP